MLGWLLIAAFFASLLAVALNAARPRRRQPQRAVRPAPPPTGGVIMATASLTLTLNLQRAQGVDTGETLIQWVKRLWLDGRIELDDMESRVAAILRGDRSERLTLAGAERDHFDRQQARNEAAEAERKRLAAAARFVRD